MLGRLTADGGLIIDRAVRRFGCYFDAGKALVVCPACGQGREYRGQAVVTSKAESEVARPR